MTNATWMLLKEYFVTWNLLRFNDYFYLRLDIWNSWHTMMLIVLVVLSRGGHVHIILLALVVYLFHGGWRRKVFYLIQQKKLNTIYVSFMVVVVTLWSRRNSDWSHIVDATQLNIVVNMLYHEHTKHVEIDYYFV